MNIEEIKELAEKLKKQGKMKFPEAAADEQISAFENAHAVVLPEKYKEWLRYSDGGEFFLPAGVQFYGVAHKPLIHVDDKDRPSENFIVIGALASGDPILFEKEKETVSIYNREADRIEADEIYEDFFAFINDLDGILGVGE